jgi:hypothetical protein
MGSLSSLSEVLRGLIVSDIERFGLIIKAVGMQVE